MAYLLSDPSGVTAFVLMHGRLDEIRINGVNIVLEHQVARPSSSSFTNMLKLRDTVPRRHTSQVFR